MGRFLGACACAGPVVGWKGACSELGPSITPHSQLLPVVMRLLVIPDQWAALWLPAFPSFSSHLNPSLILVLFEPIALDLSGAGKVQSALREPGRGCAKPLMV